MYKRLFKKSTAIILASALIFSSSTVYAQEAELGKEEGLVKSEQPLEESIQKSDNEVSKDQKEEEKILQEKTGKETKEENQDQQKKEKDGTGETDDIHKDKTDISENEKVAKKSGDNQAEETEIDKKNGTSGNLLQTNESVKEKTADTLLIENPSVSIAGPSYRDEAGTGIKNILPIRLSNNGSDTISITSTNYEMKIVPEGEPAGMNFLNMTEELDSKGQEIQPGGFISLYPQYTISQDYEGKTIDYTVQLIEKISGDVIAESQVISADVFSAENGVLRYHDTTKGEKYLLTFELGQDVAFQGIISGGTGNSTIVGTGPDTASYQYYLEPGNPSSFMFGIPEEKSLSLELSPADAGTVNMVFGSNQAVSVDLHAPAKLKVEISDNLMLNTGNGISISSPSTAVGNYGVFTGESFLKAEAFTDENIIDEWKKEIDPYAKTQGYELEIALPDSFDYTRFGPKEEINVILPIPEGWDTARTEVYTVNEYGFTGPLGTISEDGKNISFKTMDFTEINTLNCVLIEKSIPTEVKDWERVVSNYYETVRAVNWFREPLENHYFDSVPSANDAAYLTYHFSGKFYINSSYYNSETNEIRIPYEDFTGEVERYFKNIPDLTRVNIPDYMYYDEDENQFILPVGGGAGDAPYHYTLVDTKEAGGIYALWFDIAEEDANCTLIVEDNGRGDWRYLAFLEGFQELKQVDMGDPDVTEQPEDSDVADQPKDPQTPEQPENIQESDNLQNLEQTVSSELSQEQIQNIIEEIQNAEAGKMISVSMGSTTVVPEEILKNAQGKDVTLVLEMNGYSWIIYGKDITASDLKDIDLEVRTDLNAISEKEVRKIAGDNPTKQITLIHSGTFGFKAVLKIYIGTEYDGKYGNLFWFKNGTTSELTDTDQIDNQGYAEFTFTHASDYLIVINDKVMSDNSLQGQMVSNQKIDEKTGEKTVKAVKTGDSADTVVYLCMMGLAGFAFVHAFQKRRNR